MAKVTHVIVDSSALIKRAKIESFGETAYSVPDAINEIKDKQTREHIQCLPFGLVLKKPTEEALRIVTEFSKKTGDFQVLSDIDLQLLALTYDLENAFVGTDHLFKEPRENAKNAISSSNNEATLADLQSPSDEMETAAAANSADLELEADDDGKEDSGSEDDDDGWITAENFAEKAASNFGFGSSVSNTLKSLTPDSCPKVACLTTDFAMQNVLLQMGLRVLSLDGMLVTRLRNYILWCVACFHTCKRMGVYFCPKCGNSTLHRIPVTVGEDGSMQMHLKKGYRYNLRGTKFNIPATQGGKHASNPVYCADQRFPEQMPRKQKHPGVSVQASNGLIGGLDDEPALDPGWIFPQHDLSSRSARLGIKEGLRVRADRHNLKPTRAGAAVLTRRGRRK